MALDPGMLHSSHVTQTAMELAHHAHDHGHEENVKSTIHEDDKDKFVNPLTHALSKIPGPVWTGIKILGIFTLIVVGATAGAESILHHIGEWFHVPPPSVPSAIAGTVENSIWTEMFYQTGTSAHRLATVPLVVVPTAAAWFGGKSFLEAYDHAKEHNQSLMRSIKKNLLRGKQKEIELFPEDLQPELLASATSELGNERSTVDPAIKITAVTVPDGNSILIPAGGMGSPAAEKADDLDLTDNSKTKPDFLTSILENRKERSISPEAIAEQLARSRSATAEQSL